MSQARLARPIFTPRLGDSSRAHNQDHRPFLISERRKYDIYELRDDKTYSHTNERHTNRFFSVAEMEALVHGHGFVPLAAYSGFKNESAISDETWHVIAIWRKTAN
jgi:hypothetical protein